MLAGFRAGGGLWVSVGGLIPGWSGGPSLHLSRLSVWLRIAVSGVVREVAAPPSIFGEWLFGVVLGVVLWFGGFFRVLLCRVC